ncbi:GNAT family N-acetyltransferase [Halobacteriovorax marinus]|uniref:GNAT family N-acetyltransferase n=1 Tax=Halobacteriovorax marinus TaxID=97084 RepID=A0A1Y5F6V8_9BACT|nr:GNAT family N-acetyltransferase [Halobacteriovorax marinus]
MLKVKAANKNEHLDSIVNFQMEMAQETEKLSLNKEVVERGVSTVFDNPSKGRYYVVQSEDNECVASLLTMTEWSDWRCKDIIWIHSVYVIPKYRKKGVFKKMYSHLKEMVESDSDNGGLRLYVDKTNYPAQKVYESIGMSNEHYDLYEWLK